MIVPPIDGSQKGTFITIEYGQIKTSHFFFIIPS